MIPGHVPRVHTYSGSPYRTLEEFFLKHRPAEQLFKLNTARSTTIVGERGTRLTLPAHSLSNTTGQLIEGNVQVRLTEIIGPMEGLLAARPTASEDRVVDAVSQIQLNIFQEGSPLQLREPIRAEIPTRSGSRVAQAPKLFVRSMPTVRAVRSHVLLDWRESNTKVGASRVGLKRHYEFKIQRCAWYQLGYFYARRRPKVMVTAKVISTTTIFESLEAFLWLEGTSVLNKLYPNPNADQFSGLSIPADASGHIIAIGMSNGQLHFGTAHLKKAADKRVQVYIEPVSEAAILQAIQNL